MPKQIAKGGFNAKIIPEDSDAPTLGMMKLDKAYRGPLEAAGKGRMLTGLGDFKGSAVYVAMERIDGTLDGKKGSFLINHQGVMDRGIQRLEIFVVPDSGSNELKGITGKMTIDVKDRKHFYKFHYDFNPEQHETR